MLERGIVSMKGKGEQQTYFLVGEDPEYRAKRNVERQNRRNLLSSKLLKAEQTDINGHCIITRSSLKNKSNGIHGEKSNYKL